MSLAQELHPGIGNKYLYVSRINRLENLQQRIDEIVGFIKSNNHLKRVILDESPRGEELRHGLSQAIVSNTRITDIRIDHRPCDRQHMFAWITSWGTLEYMTSLKTVIVSRASDMSLQDWDLLVPLLLTCKSLQELEVFSCDDAAMSVFSRYLGGLSLISLSLHGHINLSEAAFSSLCDGLAGSSLRMLRLYCSVRRASVDTAAEHLARAIEESSLEEVWVESTLLRSALLWTTPVRNFGFCVSHGNSEVHVRIHRKWKSLLSANIPLALWACILEKAHVSPETCHSPVGILFYLLREKPDLVPAPN
jgi:hypothetical protein